MSGDRTNLPKWAQQEMERLERQRDDYKAKAFAVLENTPTRVQVDPDRSMRYSGGASPTYLPNNATVRFELGKPGDRRRYVDVDLVAVDGRYYLQLIGGDRLSMQPIASNLVEVEVRE